MVWLYETIALFIKMVCIGQDPYDLRVWMVVADARDDFKSSFGMQTYRFIDRLAIIEILVNIRISTVSVVISINQHKPNAEN